MLGQRIEPQHYHPLADELEDAKLQAFLSDIRTLVNRTVAKLPTHHAFVAHRGGVPRPAEHGIADASNPVLERNAS